MTKTGSANRRPSRGVLWLPLTAGEPAGRPFAEWAHQTPRFPNGIKNSDLKIASSAMQREVALFWFLSNFKPYDIPNVMVWGQTAWGAANWGPSPINAEQVLRGEFEGVLPVELIQHLSEALGSNWVWQDPDGRGPIPSEQTDQRDPAVLLNLVIHALDDLKASLPQLIAAHGQIGHNQPPISLDEQVDALAAIDEARAAVLEPAAVDRVRLSYAWSRFTAVAQKIGSWAAGEADIFITNFMTEAGKATGKALPVAVLSAIAIWHRWADAASLITALLKIIK